MKDIFRDPLPKGAVLIVDNQICELLALACGIFNGLHLHQSGRNRIAVCVAPIQSRFALVARFSGFDSAEDNGLIALVGSDRAALNKIALEMGGASP